MAIIISLRAWMMTIPNLSPSDLLAMPAIVLAFLQGTHFALHHATKISAMVSLILFLLSAFLLLSLSEAFQYPPFLSFLLLRLAILIPGILWLLAYYLFSDEARVSNLTWGFLIGYFVLSTTGSSLELIGVMEIEPPSTAYTIFSLVPQLCMLCFGLHALYLAVRGYYSDLIELRRTVRVAFVGSMAILVIIVLGNGLGEYFQSVASNNDSVAQVLVPQVVIALYILILLLALHFYTFTLRADIRVLLDTAVPEKPSEPQVAETLSRSEKELIGRLVRAMEEEKLYAQHGYTIAQLAAHLNASEHKLRGAINRHLGYKNFNQFLNSYRLAEAASRLVNSDAPITTIAIEVGFSSLSVFNTAFRGRFGVTPTGWGL
ncbi:MAG: AraC family transcriptional regulator [Proteobacteria bacterium]|nr:AraC family transcriptional regulator [Pseudomonadota bacterium]